MNLFGNKSAGQPDQRELLEEERMRMQHQNNFGAGASGEYTHRETDFLRELLESPVKSADFTMKNMMSKDFPLANLNKAEKNKLRWDSAYIKKIYEDMHPPPRSHMAGEYRAFLMDDDLDAWGYLHSSERLVTEQFIAAFEARLTRGSDGFQQKQNNTSINISEAREQRQEEEQSKGWLKR